MRVVVIGDVSWNGNYHLGDEAMTEVAIAELRRRGVQVTLVAGDPGISAPFYDVDAVPRFGYRTIYRREPKIRHLEAILAGARGEGEIPAEAVRAVDAVRAADAVVIAGGGNLNSSGMHHIFERLTLKRLAEHFGIPLYVSSQTFGPHLLPEDRELVGEIASYARAFGARERTTAALMREIVGDAGNVVHTLDDAILLEPSRSPEEARELLGLSERYVVGSFTYHAWSTGLSREEYYRKLAVMLDQIVAEQDVDVVLLPHMGKLGDTEDLGQDGDRFGHERIAAYTASGRVRSFDIISARDLLAVTAGAVFTLSTRYHPVVFGAAVGTPAIGIVTSYYSAVRMRGALANLGMESFAIPYEAWTPLFGSRALAALRNDGEKIRAGVRAVGLAQREYQSSWWDGIVADIRDGGSAVREDLPTAPELSWADARDEELLAVTRVAQEGTNLYRLNASFTEQDHASRIGRLEKQLADTREEFARLQAQYGELRHRMRPPGAALRDRVRLKLRGLRGK
jgi:polysaccharide pyruvyl transferase WcaK-like protein